MPGTTRKITKRVVDALKPGEIVWDSQIAGFGARRRHTSSRYYVLKYRVGKRQRWVTIGRHGSPWTVETARRRAKKLLGEVADGQDPAADRDKEKGDITVSELCDRYIKEAKAGRILTKSKRPKKPTTLATDEGRIKRHIKPLLGRHNVRDLTKADVEKFMHDVAEGKTAADEKTKPKGRAIVTGGHGTASRTVGLLGGIFSYAIKRGIRPDNPVQGVERFDDQRRDRVLSSKEAKRLGKALATAERDGANKYAVAGIRLLALTGCRKSEILNLQWRHVDFEAGCLRLPDSKTGARVIPLGVPALEVLEGLPRVKDNPHVLPGEKKAAALVGLPKFWERIRKRAKLEDVRLHDLRHWFASAGAGKGESLLLIGTLLGHRDPKTTTRYAHPGQDPAKAVADRISASVAAAMKGTEAEIVERSHKVAKSA